MPIFPCHSRPDPARQLPAHRKAPAALISMLVLLAAVLGACAGTEVEEPAAEAEPPTPKSAFELGEPTPPATPACDNDRFADFDELVIFAPHPDDEVLGFTGLADSFARQGKPVDVYVVTDGDAYCEACRLWNTGSIDGETCDAATLSNFDTPEMDSLAEARRLESTEAAARLGRPAPTFLGYPDTGLGAAWANHQAGEPDKSLQRSDFSGCDGSCGNCGDGYASGPVTELSATSLIATLSERLGRTGEKTLIATTHWLDGHGDHAGLGSFVREQVAALDSPRAVAYATIHAHTAKDHAIADCWYPGPAAVPCPCDDQARIDADPEWLVSMRDYRFRPSWPQVLPDDAEYGEPVQLCLPEELYAGEDGGKKAHAIEAFGSQLGTMGRTPDLLPEARVGLLDCSGYLISFARSTEVFVLETAGGEPSA